MNSPLNLENITVNTINRLSGNELAGNSVFNDIKFIFEMNNPVLLLMMPIAVLFTYWMLKFVRNRFKNFFRKKGYKTFSWLALSFDHLKNFFLLSLSIYFAAHFIELTPSIIKGVRLYLSVCIWIQFTVLLHFGVMKIIHKMIDKKAVENPTAESARPICLLLSKSLVWAFGFLLVLNALGFDITAILAGLGIGGMALALASQKILADLFASISIIADNPFRVGETIQSGDVKGVVEYIGMKTTQVRADTGELLFCPNATLTSAKVKNLSRMLINEKPMSIKLFLSDETSIDQLNQATEIMRETVNSYSELKFDLARLSDCPNGNFKFTVGFFVTKDHIDKAGSLREKVLYDILQKLAENKINLSRTVAEIPAV